MYCWANCKILKRHCQKLVHQKNSWHSRTPKEPSKSFIESIVPPYDFWQTLLENWKNEKGNNQKIAFSKVR